MIESQIAYILDALRHLDRSGAAAVDVREDALASYHDAVQDTMRGTVGIVGGCASWYLDRHGRNTTLWPRFTFQFRAQTRQFDAGSYETVPRRAGRRQRERMA